MFVFQVYFVLAGIGSQTVEPEKAHDLPSEIWEASDGSDELWNVAKQKENGEDPSPRLEKKRTNGSWRLMSQLKQLEWTEFSSFDFSWLHHRMNDAHVHYHITCFT